MKNNTFGNRVRELRCVNGLSLRDAADKLHIHYSYLSRIETGVYPAPSEAVVENMDDLLYAGYGDSLLSIAFPDYQTHCALNSLLALCMVIDGESSTTEKCFKALARNHASHPCWPIASSFHDKIAKYLNREEATR